MNAHESIPVIVFFALLFGVCYLYFTTRHRERMSMIEKGLAPQMARPMDHPLRSLKNGMLFIGTGIGVIAGYIFSANTDPGDDNPLPYFVGICIFGGLALVLFYAYFGRKQQG